MFSLLFLVQNVNCSSRCSPPHFSVFVCFFISLIRLQSTFSFKVLREVIFVSKWGIGYCMYGKNMSDSINAMLFEWRNAFKYIWGNELKFNRFLLFIWSLIQIFLSWVYRWFIPLISTSLQIHCFENVEKLLNKKYTKKIHKNFNNDT